MVLVIFLCSLTAINANEYNDTTTTESNGLNEPDYDNTLASSSTDTYTKTAENITTKNIQKNKNTELLKTSSNNGTHFELKQLLNDASTGSTIYLDKDYYYEEPLGDRVPVTINKTLTIDGQGHTLDGIHHMRILRITADNVVLRNISFINAFSLLDSGGVAIDWLGNNGVLEDCTFKDCIPRSEGAIEGTVYVKGDSFTARNCYSENNAAFRGAGFYLNSNNNNIINCTFNRNNGYNDDFEHQLYFKHSAGSGIFINGDNNFINNCVF